MHLRGCKLVLLLWVFVWLPTISFSMDNADESLAQNIATKLPNAVVIIDGKIIACSGKTIFAFDSNGTIAWTIFLGYACVEDIPPVVDESGTIYLIAEDRIFKLHPSNADKTYYQLESLFSLNTTTGGLQMIIGLSISPSYSVLFVNIKNRGLFAFSLHGQLIWSAGPMLYRYGYRQGCKGNLTDCYFISSPVVDQCEGTLYMINSHGQVYSLYIRSPHFRWIQDFSSVDTVMTIVPGNNGRVYISFPRRGLLMSLEAYTGSVLWQSTIGPLSTKNSLPVVDSNGWISIGSLDGILYSFSPSGEVRKFLEATAHDSVIQANPVLHCSGLAVYISQTKMETKSSHVACNYSYVSAMNPVQVTVSLLSPATGTVYWNSKFPGELSSLLSTTNLKNFPLDGQLLLNVLASARIGSMLSCYTAKRKLSWTCAQGEPEFISVYTGHEKVIAVFVLLQFVVLTVLAFLVRFCCIFWRKEKIQDHGLGKFLEKRRSLQNKSKTFSRMISQLQQEAAEDATTSETMEKLGDIVKAKEEIQRKLSTSYSLGRDSVLSRKHSMLPLYDRDSDYDTETSSNKINVSESSSSSEDGQQILRPLKSMDSNFWKKDEEYSCKMSENENEIIVESKQQGMRRRTLSSTN